jgi:hypothetical protein
MKKLLVLAPTLLLSIVLAGSAPRTAPQDQALEARVAALETELGSLKKVQTEMHALLEHMAAQLEAQAKSAQAMLAVLDQVEQLGFTAGINFESRVTLLAGMRAYLGTLTQGQAKTPAPAAPAGKAQGRAPQKTPQ